MRLLLKFFGWQQITFRHQLDQEVDLLFAQQSDFF